MARFNISSILPLALLALFCFISLASASSPSGTGSVASSTANGTYTAPSKTASSTSGHTSTAATSTSTPSSLVSASNSFTGSGNEMLALMLAGVVGSLIFGL